MPNPTAPKPAIIMAGDKVGTLTYIKPEGTRGERAAAKAEGKPAMSMREKREALDARRCAFVADDVASLDHHRRSRQFVDVVERISTECNQVGVLAYIDAAQVIALAQQPRRIHRRAADGFGGRHSRLTRQDHTLLHVQTMMIARSAGIGDERKRAQARSHRRHSTAR